VIQLRSAGLDVFPDEPNINPALRNNDQITILPHMGTEVSPCSFFIVRAFVYARMSRRSRRSTRWRSRC
jgi:phosphoglycerate dehydrogenase-like enzyme